MAIGTFFVITHLHIFSKIAFLVKNEDGFHKRKIHIKIDVSACNPPQIIIINAPANSHSHTR